MKTALRTAFYILLTLFVLGTFWYTNNIDFVNVQLGNYYHANNNLEKAFTYWEKAFDNGYNDSNLKEEYVDIIIKEPLTVENQEKLVKIALQDDSEPAALTAKYYLQDLMMEIHRKFPLNYIQQAPVNQKIVHWGKLPITYSIKTSVPTPDDILNEIDNAFLTWERESKGRVRFEKVNSDSANIVIDFQSNNGQSFSTHYIVAYTIPEILQNKLNKMTINFSLQGINGEYFTPKEIYNTALHEIFHALGFMGHSFNPNNIMYMSKNNNVNKNDGRQELNESDLSTLDLLYRIKPDVTNAEELKYDYVPYLILGNDGDINYAKRKAARDYISKAPTLPNGYIDLAESYVTQKNYSKAITNLQKGLKYSQSDDTKYVIYYNLAICNYYLENYEEAIKFANQAKQIKESEEIHFVLVQIYLKQNDTKNSISEYNYLIQKAPNNIDYATGLTNLYLKNHNYLSARKTIKTYIAKNPQEKDNSKLKQYKLLMLK